MADLHTNETNTALMSPLLHLKLPYNGESEALQSNNKLMHHHYQDHSNDFPSRTITNNKIDDEREAKLFPIKLHNMLENVEQFGIESIVSWQPHGRCFVVHKQQEFINIMSKYFRQTKFPSFQRQLNIYGFSRITRGLDKGGYYHELFLRGRSFLCRGMQRMKIKGTRVRMATNPETEPNFYSMPPVFRRSCLIMDDNCLINESAPLPPPPLSRYSEENDNQTEIIIVNNDNIMTTECTASPPPPPLIRRISSEEEQINTFTETKNHNYDHNFETSMLSSYSTKNEENKREEDEWDIDNSSLLKIADDEKKIFYSTTTTSRNSPDNHCHNHQTRKTNNNNGKNALMSMELISESNDFFKKKTEKKPHDHQVFIEAKNDHFFTGKYNFIDANGSSRKKSGGSSSSPLTNIVFDIDDVFSEFDEAIPLPGNASDFDELNDDLFFSSCC